MKHYELYLKRYHTPLTADEIAHLFHSGRLRLDDRCREVGALDWRTIDELFPLLKYNSTSSLGLPRSAGPVPRVPSTLDYSDQAGDVVQPMTSALKAGWICFGIGMLVSWFFPIANVFFGIAIITSIVAMCTHQVNRGLALLLTAFAGIAVSLIMFFMVIVGTAAVVAGPAIKKANADIQRSRDAQDRAFQQLQRSQQQMQTALSTAANQLSTPQSNATPSYNAAADRRRQYEIAMQQKAAAERAAASQRQR